MEAAPDGIGTGIVALVLDWCEDKEWGVMWGAWTPNGADKFARVPIDETDSRWHEAEGSGELGRQTAARWAGEVLGISAPPELWHVFHPTTG